MNFLPLLILCPESLGLTRPVVGNDFICGPENILGRTVILFQPDHCSVRKNMLKPKNIANIGASEFVDGLVIISYYTEIFIF